MDSFVVGVASVRSVLVGVGVGRRLLDVGLQSQFL